MSAVDENFRNSKQSIIQISNELKSMAKIFKNKYINKEEEEIGQAYTKGWGKIEFKT